MMRNAPDRLAADAAISLAVHGQLNAVLIRLHGVRWWAHDNPAACRSEIFDHSFQVAGADRQWRSTALFLSALPLSEFVRGMRRFDA